MIRVVVIAGTPVDTKMGVDYLQQKSSEYCMPVCDPVYRPAAEDCDAQVRFQYSDEANKRKRLDEIFNPDEPFKPVEDIKTCRFCPYAQLCGRG